MYGFYTNILWFETALWASGTFEVGRRKASRFMEPISASRFHHGLRPPRVISFSEGSWNPSRPADLTTVCCRHAPSHSPEVHGTFLGPQISPRSAATARDLIQWGFMEPISARRFRHGLLPHARSHSVGFMEPFSDLRLVFYVKIFMLQHSHILANLH